MNEEIYLKEKSWIPLDSSYLKDEKFSQVIATKYLAKFSDKYIGFNEKEIFKTLHKGLVDFTAIFQWYISDIIEKLEPKTKFYSYDYLNESIEAVFTFNYSNSFQRFYNTTLSGVNKVRHLHGSAEQGNIVLGISDLNENLRKYKIFNFVKTYQKILYDTDYQFLNEENLKKVKLRGMPILTHEIIFEFIIWGHSLDISDEEYIRELFSLNQPNANYKARIIVLYHSQSHDSLANLMNIMGKDIIQEWKKNDWLRFERTLEIYNYPDKNDEQINYLNLN